MGAKIWYLYHSGFAVDTGGHVLVFDYWRDTPKGGGLDQGVVDPKALRDRDVMVFASHKHGDHYNPVILKWGREIPKYRLVLSDDIPPAKDALMMGPHQRLEQPDVTVETVLSNDQGIAFLVEIDGLRIYHAGDLNWWHWEGEPDPWNPDIKASYQQEIGRLTEGPIDLAFVPVDPRLGEQYNWGINYIMERKNIAKVLPMHFGDDAATVDRLLADPATAPFRDKVIPLKARGQSARID